MNYLKNLIKILLIAQCFSLSLSLSLLLSVCDNKEIVSTKQNELNLVDFVKCPFNEEFKNNTNLEKYVSKKFGKPDNFRKWRSSLGDAASADIIVDKIKLGYENYSFSIYRGINKRFEVFHEIAMIFTLDDPDLKYGLNNGTTIKDIEKLFGKNGDVKNIQREENDTASDTIYYYVYSDDGPYVYHLSITFRRGKLNSIDINVNISF